MNANEICEVRIQTEGYRSGYIVRIVDEDNTTVYHLEKNELIGLIEKLNRVAVEKGTVDKLWRKVA